MILNTALLCMALNVYHESRGESIAGQIAVAQVTMNRAGQERNVCNVALEPNQFSWTRKLVKGKRVTKRGMPTDMEAWNHALTIKPGRFNRRDSRLYRWSQVLPRKDTPPVMA